MSSASAVKTGNFTISQTFQSFDSLKNIRNLSLDATGIAVIEQPAPNCLNRAWTCLLSLCRDGKSSKPQCDSSTLAVLVHILSNLKEQNLETFRTDIQNKRIFCNLDKNQRSLVVSIITQKISPCIGIDEVEKKSDSEKVLPLLAPQHETPVRASLERTPPDVSSKKQEAELSPPTPAQPAPTASTPSIFSVAQLYTFTRQKKKDDSDSSGEEYVHRPTQEISISWQQDYERTMEMLTERRRPAQQRQPAALTPQPLPAPLPQTDQDALRRRPLQSVETRIKETGTIIPKFGVKVLPEEKRM